MGNQGARGDGVRQLIDWYNAGVIGDVHKYIVILTGRFGRRELIVAKATSTVPPEFDWIYGWVLLHKKIIWITLFPSTGVAGGIMVPVLWVIWLVILCTCVCSTGFRLSCLLPNAVLQQDTLQTGRKHIILTVGRLHHTSFSRLNKKENKI